MSLKDLVNQSSETQEVSEGPEGYRIVQPQINDFNPSKVDGRYIDIIQKFAHKRKYRWSDTLIARQAALMEHGKENEYSHGQHEIDVGKKIKEILNLIENKENGVWTIIAKTRAKIIIEGGFLHDVGKTGPNGSDPAPFVHFYNFNVPLGKGRRTIDIPFREALDEAIQKEAITRKEAEYILYVLQLCGLNTDTMSLRDFYNLHTIFGGMILAEENIEPYLKTIVPSHHMGKRENNLSGFRAPSSLLPESAIIEVVDTGVAMSRRPNNPASKRTIQENIQVLESQYRVNNSTDSSLQAKICCEDFIDTLRRERLLPLLFNNHIEED